MLTWDQCFEAGLTAKDAALQMNCSPRTADRSLRQAAMRFDARQAAHAAAEVRFNKDVNRLAHTETRPKSERSSYPAPLLEVSDLYLGITRSPVGPLTDTIRNKAATGIPFEEITTTDGASRAQPVFDAIKRYREAWERIDAREAASVASTP